MSYSGANFRHIKSLSGGRGMLSQMKTRSVSSGNNKINNPNGSGNDGTSGVGNSSSNIALKAQLKTYSKIAMDSAADLQTSGDLLTKVGENSLFDKAEKSNDTKKVVGQVTDFVNSYNNMMSGITKLGGAENKEYIAELKKFADENKEALKEVGITVLKDGSMTMNKKELEEASLDKLKKLFNGEDSFAGKVTDLSKDIEKSVEQKLKENLLILGGMGGSSSRGNSNGGTGNYFNLSV